MIPRLYWEGALEEGAETALPVELVHYLRNVMRRQAGDELRLFNAQSGEHSAVVLSLSKRDGVLRIGPQRRAPQTVPDITLAMALIKRARLEQVVEKATELGVARIQPLLTQYSGRHDWKPERAASIAREAAEQTERCDVPALLSPLSLADFLEDPSAQTLVFADESLARPDLYPPGEGGARASSSPWKLPLVVLIGPEGGFSPEERTRIRAHPAAAPLYLGPRILRADTAAIAALTLVQHACGDWGTGEGHEKG